METIIITVTDPTNRFLEDLEVPVNLTMDKLKEDMIQSLNGYHPELQLQKYNIRVINGRRKRLLKETETLEQAGVWNGDYLVLIDAETQKDYLKQII